MGNCKICGKSKSQFIMNNRSVCMACDELVFDLEIECDEEYVQAKPTETATKETTPKIRRVPNTIKK